MPDDEHGPDSTPADDTRDGTGATGGTVAVSTEERSAAAEADRADASGEGATDTDARPDATAEPAANDDTSAEGRPPRRDRPSEADLEREILDPEERVGPGEQYCVHCQAVFDADHGTCPDCGHPYPGETDPPASTRKNPAFAGVLSALVPGAGQLYNEQFGRGLAAFFGTVFLVGTIALFGLAVDVFVTVASLGVLSVLGTAILFLAVAFGWLLPASVAAWDAYDQAKGF
jgi:TM2 domain-containing membrane protein YozV